MAKNANKLRIALAPELPKATIEYLELKDEAHETVFPVSISRGLLRFLAR